MIMRPVFSQENFATDKYILVEVSTAAKVAAAGTQYFLPDTPELRMNEGMVYTNAIQAYTASQLTTAPSGEAVVPAAEIINSVLVVTTIQEGNSEERIVRIPMFDLIASSNGGYIKTVLNLPIIITKSYVEMMNGTITAGVSFLFGFHYFTGADYKKRMEARKRANG